jgi:mono/diheme cytochrome c family protein
MGITLGAVHYRAISPSDPHVSNDMHRGPLRFSRSGGDIGAKTDRGLMGAADISNGARGNVMYSIVRYSLTIAATFCLALAAHDTALSAEGRRLSGDADAGRDLYLAHCSACHQTGGDGLPGVFPPLKGSGVVNKDDATKHIHLVLDGMQGARAGGVVYAAAMPSFAGALSDAEIADIINYERSAWGNHGTPVTVVQIAAERGRQK